MRGWLGRFVSLLVVMMLGACGGTDTAPEHDRAISAGKPFVHSIDALVESGNAQALRQCCRQGARVLVVAGAGICIGYLI